MTIKIDQVTLYNADKQDPAILQNLSCELEDGTITLLIGQTGAGKSSLLDVLAGLRPADTGHVWYDGLPLWKGKRLHPEVQAQIGVVFQYPEHQLFARTVEKEFAYSLRPLHLPSEEVQSRTRSALLQMGLPEEIISQSPLQLSGGQKRRVALGTTFATQPKWLFLDEPTAGLDPQSVQRLVRFLQDWKEQTHGGIVMATHDLDAMFPIADRVIVVDQGRILAHLTPQELCENPDILLQARIGLPSSVQIALALGQQGLSVPPGPVSPTEMAKVIAERLTQEKHMQDERLENQQMQSGQVQSEYLKNEVPMAHGNVFIHSEANTPKHTSTSLLAHVDDVQNSSSKNFADTTANSTQANNDVQTHANGAMQLPTHASHAPEKHLSIVHALDPRAKWLFYFLFSVAILLQNSWAGLLVTTILTWIAVLLSRVTRQELLRVVKPFLYFILFSAVLSGLRFGDVQHELHLGHVGFAWDSALYTFRQTFKVLLVMALGVVLSTTTSQLRMKRALEQSLSFLSRLHIPVEALSLGASLMLRFVPVIMRELERFSRITRARGRSSAKTGGLHLRDVNVVIIPLLLSVLQLGEDLSLAMEARGYSKIGQTRTSSIQLKMNRTDRLTMLYGVILFLLLVALSRFLS